MPTLDREQVLRRCPLPLGRVAFVDEHAACPNNGVVFAHAAWSGQSVAALSWLAAGLAERTDPLALHILDADALPVWFRHHMDVHGYGETLVLIDGRVTAAFAAYKRFQAGDELSELLAQAWAPASG